MTIMKTEQDVDESNSPENEQKHPNADAPKAEEADKGEQKGMFSDANLGKDTEIPPRDKDKAPILATPEDKVGFIDAMVENRRFTKRYSLFGGRIKFTLRSLTSDEVNALSAWTVKQGSKDPAALMSGRYRKYLAAAHVAEFNGTEMPPLEEPLFEKLAEDGKAAVPPGWVNRCGFWDGMEYGLFNSVMSCIEKFDGLYSMMCTMAQDENFWNPDTP